MASIRDLLDDVKEGWADCFAGAFEDLGTIDSLPLHALHQTLHGTHYFSHKLPYSLTNFLDQHHKLPGTFPVTLFNHPSTHTLHHTIT